MKKIFIKIISLLCVALMILPMLFACQNSSSQQTEAPSNVHTIKFNSNGGTPISDIEVRHGQKMAEPAAPTRENYIFLYWEHNNRRWLFTTKEITEDMTFSALWISANDLFKTVPAENENEIMISGFAAQKSINVLRIPNKINGKTVVGFTDNAFETIHEQHAKSIIIPETATRVGNASFKNISEVHIEILGSLNQLGVSSFEQCMHLEKVSLATGLTTIPYRCFFEAKELITVDIPEGVKIIEENAFSSCVKLQTVVLPSTLETIEDGAFVDASNIAVVFFKGSEEQFDAINISANNNELLSAEVYFYSEEQPTSEGKFWHYDKSNTPILW